MKDGFTLDDVLPQKRPVITDPVAAATVHGVERLLDLLEASTPTRSGDSFQKWAASRLQIRDKEGQLVPFILNGVQIPYLKQKSDALAAGRKPRFLVLKYRRGGITTIEQGLSYRMAVSVRNAQLVTLAHQKESTKRIFRIPRLMHEKDQYAPAIKGIGNTYELDFPRLNSYFFIGTAGSRGFGRGDTLQRVHGSEVAWWFKGSARKEDQRQLVAGITEAASHGEVILETTPNGSEWFREAYQEAKRGLNDWTPIFLPWFIDKTNRQSGSEAEHVELADTITDEEKSMVSRHGLDSEMLLWRRSKQRDLKTLFLQEYPEDDESCFLLSGTSYFNTERITQLLRSVPETERVHIPGGIRMTWKAVEKGRRYVAGTDTSEGLPGCDPNGTGILDFQTGEQVATIHGIFKPAVLAAETAKLCTEYNNAYLGVERENHGHAVLQKLDDLGYKGRRRLYSFKKGRTGWSTNSATRPIMLDNLAEAIEEDGGGMIVNDRDFLGEMLTFRMQSDGKWGHDTGEHDDTVFKWGIAWQMRRAKPRGPRIVLLGSDGKEDDEEDDDN